VKKPIPYEEIDTLFLDAGNTLVSVDFGWVRQELRALGIEAEVESLRRAEAAARPAVSEAVTESRRTEGRVQFEFYLRSVLERLDVTGDLGDAALRSLVDALAPVLGAPGLTQRLWSWVMPGVETALEALRAQELQLVVVSNSDGSVEQGLTDLGLLPYLDAVIDSHVVGFEKPDPRIFEHALDVAGADPEQTLHVGDIYAADVEGARAAGIHALLLDPYGDWDGVDCERQADVAEVSRALTEARERGR
jgi:putative hydrolase of the HAD superfamily